MGKGGLAAGGDGGGSGGGEGAAIVGLGGLAVRFLPFFTIASADSTMLSGGTMGKGGSAAGGDGGGSGGGEGAAIVGLDSLAVRFLPFLGMIPKGMINFLCSYDFTPG
jgi:hypothetical protein